MSMFATTLANKCPYCRQGQLFDGWFTLRETCDVCGARYDRWVGSWTGPVAIGYGIGAVVGVGLGVLTILTNTYFEGEEILIGLAACAVVVASYRFVKAWWIALLYEWGYIFPDPPVKEREA